MSLHTAPGPDLRFETNRHWFRWTSGDLTVWWSGQAFFDGISREGRDAAETFGHAFRKLLPTVDAGAAERLLLTVDGHFAVVATAGDITLASADRVRSIPVLVRLDRAGNLQGASGHVGALVDGPGMAADADASLAVAMSGYALDGRTLYRDIRFLSAGELLLATSGRPAARHIWYQYRPWQTETGVSDAGWRRRLTAANEALFEKLARSLEGRTVMLPLSGGFDSRLVVSGLHHVGYRNIICYSYGRAHNEEAKAAEAIAARLGLPWHYIAYDWESVAAALHGEDFTAYCHGADTGAAVPFFQDFAAVQGLKQRGLVPDGAVFINGNSGDFISGNHVPLAVFDHMGGLSAEACRDSLVRQFVAKHFALWQDLSTPENNARIAALIVDWMNRRVPQDLPAGLMYAAWEAVEFSARQATFVINGQRVYEHFGHAWRLPLWENDYVAFWEKVPGEYKRAQTLYRSVLQDNDWGGVWNGIPLNPPQRWHLPFWARALRGGVKLAAAPFGRSAWQRVDRQIFHYWIDVLATYAVAPYRTVLTNQRGFRSSLSFRCASYLAQHGRRPDGQPL